MPRGIPDTGKRKKGAGPKPLPPELKKVRAVTYVEPDLADWLRSEPGLHYQIIEDAYAHKENWKMFKVTYTLATGKEINITNHYKEKTFKTLDKAQEFMEELKANNSVSNVKLIY